MVYLYAIRCLQHQSMHTDLPPATTTSYVGERVGRSVELSSEPVIPAEPLDVLVIDVSEQPIVQWYCGHT